jgi:ribosome maturation factor RimP
MVQERDLAGIINPELELLGFECVKLEVVGSTRSPVVRLYIDKPGGVTVSDCQQLSHEVGDLIDVSNLVRRIALTADSLEDRLTRGRDLF